MTLVTAPARGRRQRRRGGALCESGFCPTESHRGSAHTYDAWVDGWVYFALDAPSAQVKIGVTMDVARRIDELRARRPNLELLAALRGGYNLERALHGRFEPFRREGQEWYSTEILGELATIVANDLVYPDVFS